MHYFYCKFAETTNEIISNNEKLWNNITFTFWETSGQSGDESDETILI